MVKTATINNCAAIAQLIENFAAENQPDVAACSWSHLDVHTGVVEAGIDGVFIGAQTLSFFGIAGGNQFKKEFFDIPLMMCIAQFFNRALSWIRPR